jgi:hypothetical protein
MLVYAVEGSGLISLYEQENGDLAVSYTGTGQVERVIALVCTPDNAYWQPKYRHWVIRSHSRPAALGMLDEQATWLAADNMLLMRPACGARMMANSAL